MAPIVKYSIITFLYAILVLDFSNVLANHSNLEKKKSTGHVFLGFGGGVVNWSGTTAGFDDNGALDGKSEGGNATGLIQLLLGYNYYRQNWLLGGELFGKYIPGTSKLTGAGLVFVKWRGEYTYGINFKFGHTVNLHTILYIFLGAEHLNLRFNAHGDDPGEQISFSKNSFSVAPGIGIQAYITQYWLIDARYSWIFFPRIIKIYDDGDKITSNLSRGFFIISIIRQF